MVVVLGAIVALAALALIVFYVGRDRATELTDDQALIDFRAASGTTESSDLGDNLPPAGVYAATASGQESIGLPGFDETFGPNAPVTLTHGDGGCMTYRADLNSHHWRSWTFCPGDEAGFTLVELQSFTARKAPGLDLATLSTYRCEQPLNVFATDAAVGEVRTGSCTGTSDIDDSVTQDAARAEVLEDTTLDVGGDRVDVRRVRTTDTFSGAQSGQEVGEWWLDATTGLPLKLSIDARLDGGVSDYAEQIELALTSTSPST